MHNTPDQTQHNKQIVWGLRVPKALKARFQVLAATTGIPVSHLVEKALEDWLGTKTEDQAEEERKKFTKAILELQMAYAGKMTSGAGHGLAAEDDTICLRVHMSIRGVSLETRLRLKVISLASGTPIYRVLDQMVAKEWKELGKREVPKRISSRMRRELRRLLQGQFKD